MPKRVYYDTYIIEKYGKYERKRKAAWVNCNYCDKRFLKRIQYIKKNNYCCPEHASLVNRKRIKVICAYCGLEKEITQSKYNNSKTKTFFCNRDHQSKAQKFDCEINYLCNYVNGNSSYRKEALKYYPNKCENCQYDEHKEILEVHHIDCNRENNDLKNLIILCPNCHVGLTRKYAILENRKLKWLDDKLFEF